MSNKDAQSQHTSAKQAENVHVSCEHAEHLRLTSLYLEARRSWTSWALSFKHPEPRGDLLLQRPRTSTFLQAATQKAPQTFTSCQGDAQNQLTICRRGWSQVLVLITGEECLPRGGKCGSSGQRSDEKSLRWLSAACCSLARTGDTMRGQQRSGWFHQSGEISCHRQILLLFSSVFLFTHLCFIRFLSSFLFHLSGHGFTSCFWASPFLWMSSSGSPVSEPRLQLVLPPCCMFVWILLCLRSLEADGA